MIVVRNVFRLKFGKAKKGVALLKEGIAIQKRAGVEINQRIFAIWTVGLLALATSCNQAPQPVDTHEADIQAVKDNEAQWNKDYQAKDLEKIVAHYTDDAVLIAPGTQPSIGKEAIHSALKEMLADNALSLIFQTERVDVAKSGDVAYTQGSYTLTVTDSATKKPISDKGSYVTVYKKQADGSWKAVADIASSATPPGPALPAKK
jgi:uncharacterized protein (TIGR02246 family)